jgi:ATP-dependent DNA helicase RecG
MALAMYGDLDISRITEMPKGRQRVDTFLVDESYRLRLNEFIKKQVAAGGQCYIICPSIESDEDDGDDLLMPEGIGGEALVSKSALNLKSAIEYSEELSRTLKGIKVCCLHGRMKASEKDEIMSLFSEGKIDVLVSTTVIEVGVNVPNASLMIVENAERFGLSQLHQLRGRVGRGSRKSYCVLVSDAKNEKSVSRLTTMKTTYDGFEIAAKDLALRGPGDFFSHNKSDSLRQSGGFEFKLASICDDSDLFDLAFTSAKSIIEADPDLVLDDHRLLSKMLDSVVKPASTIS